jgi:hypothetical protein
MSTWLSNPLLWTGFIIFFVALVGLVITGVICRRQSDSKKCKFCEGAWLGAAIALACMFMWFLASKVSTKKAAEISESVGEIGQKYSTKAYSTASDMGKKGVDRMAKTIKRWANDD